MIELILSGQIHGGKNNMKITRTGHHYPDPKWAKWRDEKVLEIIGQLKLPFIIITKPCKIEIEYTSGDKRRRDVPAILDSLWHILEKAEIVVDDSLLADVKFTSFHDKEKPFAIIRIYN